MESTEFIDRIKSSITDLPGKEAHHKMSMVRVKDEPKQVIENAKKSAVMLLLYPKKDVWYSVLIQRPAYDGVHSRQMALPGGQYEQEDESFEMTAHRETWEEVGVKGVEILGALTFVYIKPSNFVVYPYVGYLMSEPKFKLQEDEVDSVVEFPIDLLLDETLVKTSNVETKLYGTLKVPSFVIEEKVVWGATAAMLSEFKEILKKM